MTDTPPPRPAPRVNRTGRYSFAHALDEAGHVDLERAVTTEVRMILMGTGSVTLDQVDEYAEPLAKRIIGIVEAAYGVGPDPTGGKAAALARLVAERFPGADVTVTDVPDMKAQDD